jgi:DNA-binding response OmpR family regulator
MKFSMSSKIVLIDDDKTLLRFLKEYLEGEGFQVITVDGGTKALKAFYSERPDLVILDIMMPGMDGWEVCARIREMADTPIILLTAKSSEADKMRGFRLGVDDYVVKPFSLAELTARAKAVLGRTSKGSDDEDVIFAGPVTVDLRRREARLKGELLSLTETEFRLLAALCRRPCEAVSRQKLTLEVWGANYDPKGSALRRFIWLLRQKIEADPQKPEHIFSVRGYGYRFEP